MKPLKLTLLLACLFLIASCTKKTDKKSPPNTTRAPIRLEKSVVIAEDGNRDTTAYQYNQDGQLIRIVDEDNGQVIAEFEYSGNQVVSIRKRVFDSLVNQDFYFSPALDSLRLTDRRVEPQRTVTTTHTLFFRDSLLARDLYTTSYSDNQAPFDVEQRYNYTANGVLTSFQAFLNGQPYRGRTYDESSTVRNVIVLMGPLFWLYGHDFDADFGTGRYAVQSYTTDRGEFVEFEWTTNDEGYPTAVGYKNHPDWGTYEYIYNR